MKKSRLAATVILPILTLLLGLQLGQQFERQSILTVQSAQQVEAGSGTVISDPEKEADITLLWTSWKLLMSHYVHPEELTTNKMVEGAIRGMVASVGDPYTLYMTPKENTDFRDILSGHLEGIGAELSLKDGSVVVVNAIKNSPAEKAGLLPQDIIITVDGKTLQNLTLDQIVALIRGKKGTPVVLTLLSKNDLEPRNITIIRDQIQVPSTKYETKTTANGPIGLLTIHEFGGSTIREIREILSKVHEGTEKGLIVDLRFNGGGYLDGAVDLSSMFLKTGKVVTVAGRGEDTEVHKVSGNPVLPTLPMVVLINSGSASASEIFAGALKDYKRATIIGTQSFGKGTVQEVLDLPGGSSLRVTIARWLTPNGTDLGKVGIAPDIVVDRTVEDVRADKDPQLTAALEFLTTGKVTSVKTGTGTTSY